MKISSTAVNLQGEIYSHYTLYKLEVYFILSLASMNTFF